MIRKILSFLKLIIILIIIYSISTVLFSTIILSDKLQKSNIEITIEDVDMDQKDLLKVSDSLTEIHEAILNGNASKLTAYFVNKETGEFLDESQTKEITDFASQGNNAIILNNYISQVTTNYIKNGKASPGSLEPRLEGYKFFLDLHLGTIMVELGTGLYADVTVTVNNREGIVEDGFVKFTDVIPLTVNVEANYLDDTLVEVSNIDLSKRLLNNDPEIKTYLRLFKDGIGIKLRISAGVDGAKVFVNNEELSALTDVDGSLLVDGLSMGDKIRVEKDDSRSLEYEVNDQVANGILSINMPKDTNTVQVSGNTRFNINTDVANLLETTGTTFLRQLGSSVTRENPNGMSSIVHSNATSQADIKVTVESYMRRFDSLVMTDVRLTNINENKTNYQLTFQAVETGIKNNNEVKRNATIMLNIDRDTNRVSGWNIS